MTPDVFRAWVKIFVWDMVIPLTGAYLAVYLFRNGLIKEWHPPLLAAMMGIPLVRRGKNGNGGKR